MARRDKRNSKKDTKKKEEEAEKEELNVEKEEVKAVEAVEQPKTKKAKHDKEKEDVTVADSNDVSAESEEREETPEFEVKKASDAEKKKRKKTARKTYADHPPTTEMVLDALKIMDERKGITIPALKVFITTHNTVRPEQLKHLLRKALVKLLDQQAIIRPKGSEDKSLMIGRYKIAPKPATEKAVKPRVRPPTLRALDGSKKKAPKKKKKRRKSGY